tara:strand:+ start:28 stop:660 length:633 start_codon:yes stop_codon:yes gene_type:complete
MPVSISGSGTISGVSVGGLPDGIVDADMLATDSVQTAKIVAKAATAAKLGNGAILQVQNKTFTSWDAATVTANSWWDVAASSTFEVDITPISASNKIFVFGHVYMSCSNVNTLSFVKIRRDSTDIGQGDSSSSRRQVNGAMYCEDEYHFVPLNFSCLDSPSSTSSLKYAVNIGHWSSSNRTFYINRSITDSNDYGNPRAASSITAMEIAQ